MDGSNRTVDASTLRTWLDSGCAVLVDVRESFEHATERIEGARHVPLAQVDPDRLKAESPAERVVFHCRSGARSGKALERCNEAFAAAGIQAFHLDGGIEAWKSLGHPVEHPVGGPKLDVMRQVQIVAGSLVAGGTLLGIALTPWLFIVPAFVGCGLVFAGISGHCGMARLLGLMPWNRPRSTPTG